MTTTPERFAYTAAEVAEMLALSEVQIRRHTAAGLLPCHRIGRSVRYTREDVQNYLSLFEPGDYA